MLSTYNVFSHYESILGNILTDIDLFCVPVFLAQDLIKPPRAASPGRITNVIIGNFENFEPMPDFLME